MVEKKKSEIVFFNYSHTVKLFILTYVKKKVDIVFIVELFYFGVTIKSFLCVCVCVKETLKNDKIIFVIFL